MGAVSGKNGTVKIGSSDVIELIHWEGTFTSNNPSWNSNVTGGTKKRVAGVKDSNGTITGKFDPSDPIWNTLEEGDSVTLLLYLVQSPPRWRNQPALIGELGFTVDINDGEIEEWHANWEGNGAGTWYGSP